VTNTEQHMSGSNNEKHLPVLADHSAKIYDYTIYKIQEMIAGLKERYVEHPDIYALEQILNFYKKDEIVITWDGGYPMVDLK